MNEENIIRLARMICGVILFIVHMLTGYNGSAVLLALILIGAPVEVLSLAKRKDAENTS